MGYRLQWGTTIYGARVFQRAVRDYNHDPLTQTIDTAEAT